LKSSLSLLRNDVPLGQCPYSTQGGLSSDPTFASVRRNNVRLQAELAMNTTIIGMSISFTTNQHLAPSTPTQPLQLHLSNNVDDILPPIFSTNHPGRHYLNNFIAKVKLISSRKSKTPGKSSLRFDVSREAAEHNAKQLAHYDFDVSQLISNNQNSIISYGSEFCEPPLLHLLLCDHPLWGFSERQKKKRTRY
jgi:hypothetical protein